jgi:hypothetical protein
MAERKRARIDLVYPRVVQREVQQGEVALDKSDDDDHIDEGWQLRRAGAPIA